MAVLVTAWSAHSLMAVLVLSVLVFVHYMVEFGVWSANCPSAVPMPAWSAHNLMAVLVLGVVAFVDYMLFGKGFLG